MKDCCHIAIGRCPMQVLSKAKKHGYGYGYGYGTQTQHRHVDTQFFKS